MQDELEFLVKAGFTPMEAIQAATRNCAESVGILDRVGTIEKGKRADLILLDANPLESIGNIRKISAVIRGGKLYRRNDLDALLEAAATAAPKR